MPTTVRIVARGHYDRLGLRRDATPAEVRAAYRRQALGCHPDKGGDPQQFHEVTAAFEELADATRRAAYDRNLDFFGCRDGSLTERPLGTNQSSASIPRQPQQRLIAAGPREYGAARILQERLLVSSLNSWSKLLVPTPDGTLEALRNILSSGENSDLAITDAAVLSPWGDSSSSSAGASSSGRSGANAAKGRCIHHHKHGYTVQVSWASLSVNTAHTNSLAQAIDWQIALVSVQVEAQARLRKARGRNQIQDPITEEEWHKLLSTEPSIRPVFRFAFRPGGRRGKLIQTPGVQSHRLAMSFMKRFMAITKPNPSDVTIDKVKKQALRDAAKERQNRKALEAKLKEAIKEEMQRRTNLNAQTRGIGDAPRTAAGKAAAKRESIAGKSRTHEISPRKRSTSVDSTPPKSGRGSKRAAAVVTPPKKQKAVPQKKQKVEAPRKGGSKKSAAPSSSLSKWFASSTGAR